MDTVKAMREWAENVDLIGTFKLSDGFSVWWMMDQWLHKSRGYYSNFDDIIKGIERKPSWKIYLTKYFFRLRFWLRRILSHNFPITIGRKVLFINSIKWDGENDLFFNSAMKYFDNACLVDYPTDYAAYWSVKRIFEKRKLTGNHLILEMFYDPSYKKEVKKIQERYEEMKKDKFFLDNSTRMWPALKPQMDFYVYHRMESHIRNYMALKKMVKIDKPEALVFGGEGGLYGNMCSYIGYLFNIPVIGLMHGSMNYDAKLVHYNDGCPKATKICVWGSYFKDWMIKYSGYDSKHISVIGNIKMDDFKKWDKGKVCCELGLVADKPIIAVLDQNEIDMRYVVDECKKYYPQTMVALHPARIDKEFYKDVKTIVPTRDYLKLLSCCDLVVSFGSTGVLDSMFYDKPIILVPVKDDYWDARILTDYYSEGIGVVCEDDFKENLKLALKDPFKEKRRDYIKSHLYKIDGNATKRFVDVIKHAIEIGWNNSTSFD